MIRPEDILHLENLMSFQSLGKFISSLQMSSVLIWRFTRILVDRTKMLAEMAISSVPGLLLSCILCVFYIWFLSKFSAAVQDYLYSCRKFLPWLLYQPRSNFSNNSAVSALQAYLQKSGAAGCVIVTTWTNDTALNASIPSDYHVGIYTEEAASQHGCAATTNARYVE